MTRASVCIALAVCVLALVGCVDEFNIEVTDVQLVDTYPTASADINGAVDTAWASRPEYAEAGFARVKFRTTLDLRREASARTVQPAGSFYPCEQQDSRTAGTGHLITIPSTFSRPYRGSPTAMPSTYPPG